MQKGNGKMYTFIVLFGSLALFGVIGCALEKYLDKRKRKQRLIKRMGRSEKEALQRKIDRRELIETIRTKKGGQAE